MINKQYKSSALVIGGSGFLGSTVADELTKRKYRVTIYDQKKSKWLKKNQKQIIGKISDFTKIAKAIKKNYIIYNFAGVGDLDLGSKKPLSTITENIYCNAKIIEYCIKYKVKRFIYSSTIYVYSDKGSFYRCSKQAAENYIQEYCKNSNLKYTILRFGSLYGPRSKKNNGIHKIIDEYYKTKKIKYYGSSKTIREYIFIKDAASSCVDILNKKFENKFVKLVGRKRVYVKNVLKIISRILKISHKPIFKNKKNPYHYEKNPFTFKKNYGLKYFPKNETKLEDGFREIIKILSKNYS